MYIGLYIGPGPRAQGPGFRTPGPVRCALGNGHCLLDPGPWAPRPRAPW